MEKRFEELTSMTGKELYEYAIALLQEVKKECKIIDEWARKERKRYFFMKKKLPTLKVAGLTEWELDKFAMCERESSMTWFSRFENLELAVARMTRHLIVNDKRAIDDNDYKIILLESLMKINGYTMLSKEAIKYALENL